MNDHNLDDLIIDTIEPNQHNKAKSLLTIIALAIVVLIVAIILTKILLKDPNEDKLLFEENETELISPDLTLQSITEPKEEIAEPKEEKIVEKLEEETIIPETIPASVPQKEAEENNETTQSEVNNTEPEKTSEEITPEPKAESQKVEENKPELPQKPVEEPAKAPQHTIDKAKQKPESRPLNILTRPDEASKATNSSGSYFIQVGSFSSMPSQRFLDTIKNNGFTYTTVENGGAKKLLIGPYADRASANNALIKVRDRINKNAFIYTK